MAKLVTVLKAASHLSASLFDHAQDPAFEEREAAAFRSDALMVVSATQALSVSPGSGYEAVAYDAVLAEVSQAVTASEAVVPGGAQSIHHCRLEVVQAVDAMRRATARPAVAVS